MSRYYIDASVFITGGSAFGMISGFVDLQQLPVAGSVLPEMSIEELVVDQTIENEQRDTAVSLKDIVMPSVQAAHELFKRCECKGLFTDEWNK